MSDFRIVAAGDAALTVEFEERIDPAVNAKAIHLAAAIRTAALAGVRDVVPTYRSTTVYFDPLRVDHEALRVLVHRVASGPVTFLAQAAEPFRIPVCYGDGLGPDLDEVAAFARLDPGDVVSLHTAITYRVFMLGFVPGFAYLGTVDPQIAAPRRSSPRTQVPRGSVGIAGSQTGVYPMETPGGWQIVGRTPLVPVDPRREDPFLLRAGDAVRFYAISRPELAALQAGM